MDSSADYEIKFTVMADMPVKTFVISDSKRSWQATKFTMQVIINISLLLTMFIPDTMSNSQIRKLLTTTLSGN